MGNWLKTHSLYWLLFIAFLLTFDWFILNKKRLSMKWYAALSLSLLHVVIGVLCVKFFALAEAGFNVEKAGNMSLFGAVFFLPLFYFAGAKLFKKSVADVFDVFAIAMILTLLIARINCMISGCCLGREINGGPARWPTREAELLFYIVFLVIMAPRVNKGVSIGRTYPVFMVSYGAFRAIDECFRESETAWGVFHLSHVWALVSLILGVVALVLLRKLRPVSGYRKKKER